MTVTYLLATEVRLGTALDVLGGEMGALGTMEAGGTGATELVRVD